MLLDDDVGLLEAGLDIAVAELASARAMLEGFVGFGSTPSVKMRCGCRTGAFGLHRLIDIGDVRQDLVVDLDQLQRLAGDGGADRRDGRNGMAVIERLLARHAVVEHVAACRDRHRSGREVGAGDDGLYAGQLLGLRGVDLLDLGMGVRRAQDEADELAGRGRVGAEFGAAGDLVDAVGTQRPGADDLNLRLRSGLLSSGMVRLLRHFFGGVLHGADDLVIAGAAAEIAGQAEADFRPRSAPGCGRAAPWPRSGSRACRCRIAAPHAR